MRVGRQIYYCGVSGTLAGLVAWYAIGAADAARWPNLWLSNAFVGGGVGGLLALALTVARGAVERWAWPRLVQNAPWVTGAGILAGILGMFVGQGVFELARGEWLGRTAGWVALSLLVGLAQTVREPTTRRVVVGALAGLVVGLVSGLVYEGLTQMFLNQSATAQRWGSVVGLMLVSGAFAAGIPAAERLVSPAVVIVRSGPRSGTEFVLLDKLEAGAGEGCRVYLPGDSAVEDRHAEFRTDNGSVRVRNLGVTPLLVAGVAVPSAGESPCPPGSAVRLGNTILEVA